MYICVVHVCVCDFVILRDQIPPLLPPHVGHAELATLIHHTPHTLMLYFISRPNQWC